jgi:deoxyribonuclease-1
VARRTSRSKIRLGLPVLALMALTYGVGTFFWKDPRVPHSQEPTVSSASVEPNGKGNIRIASFNKAKKLLPQVYAGHEVTFYCGCRYSKDRVDLESCGYKVKKDAKRAQRLEWEHVVPAENFGRSFLEWREGHPSCVDNQGKPFKGRNCTRKASLLFSFMESDLYNLQPAIGEVNGLRSNYRMGMIKGEKREFGQCDVEIEDRRIEPRPEIRGDVARTYFYMEWAYGHTLISDANRQLYDVWAKGYVILVHGVFLLVFLRAEGSYGGGSDSPTSASPTISARYRVMGMPRAFAAK